MDPRLAGRLATQFGFVTRRQARADGIDRLEVERLLRSGELVVARPGVLALPEAASVTKAHERQVAHDRAVCVNFGSPFVRSHTTAALELGMPVLLPPDGRTHVTGGRAGVHTTVALKHHIAPYREEDVVSVNGMEVLGYARTAVDIAREYGPPHGVVAFDSARHLGVSQAELEEVLDGMRFWPGRRGALAALALSVAGAESVGETLGRILLVELGHADIETQFGLTDGRITCFADLRVGRHLVEFDGRQKYLRMVDGGLTDRPAHEVVWEEKRREDWFRGYRLGVSRLTWDDVFGAGRVAARSRLKREIALTTRLWGTSVDDLEQFRVGRRVA